MSAPALRLAVKQVLQSVFDWQDEVCDIGLTGEPNPSCGQLFVRIHPGSWRTNDCEGLWETFGFQITVTRRLGDTPEDRSGIAVLDKPGDGLDAVCRKIFTQLHLDVNQDQILQKANLILGPSVNGFCTPLKFKGGAGLPQPKGPEWFHAQTAEGGPWMNAGVALTLTFDGADRLQTIESMA